MQDVKKCKPNSNMEITLRLEEEKDYRIVEELTREAFWDIHFPGCSEHLLVHKLRSAKEFVKELDFVAIADGKIVGNIMYAEAKVTNADKEYPVLTFGPVSVLPEYQKKGIGRKLIDHTIALSKDMGYRAIIIYGDPDYYAKYGFAASKRFGITNKENKFPAALLVLELYQGALDGISGIFDEGPAYEIDEKDAEVFDNGFEYKEKTVTKAQEKFMEMACKYL